ncbi:YbhN family protein [Streptomyces racemochromogenes]|uniref:YbhN family protein n=1 Tax=Streptomyces racemochromogenes TaxID=67353 RepID=A0ABW7P7Y2_9ACTN
MPQPRNGGDALPAAAPPGRIWWLCSGVLVLAAAVFAFTRRAEIAAALRLVTQVRPGRLPVPLACQVLSLVCFAAVPRWLLRAGGVRWSLRRMACTTAAGSAVAGALPGGAAFSAAWLLRVLVRRGVGPVLAAAVLAVSGAASVVSLLLLVAVGALAAGPSGPGAALRSLLPLLLALLVAVPVLVWLLRSAAVRRALGRVWKRTGHRSGRLRRVQADLSALVEQARRVEPRPLPWLRPLGYALLNWLFDLACLATALWALGLAVPWRGLVAAYALTQAVGSLRLTPGSLGIAEATMSALLVASGLPSAQAVAATFLYRIIGFWMLQPVGWTCWAALTLEDAHGPAKRGG